jgi:hypothetical protein
VLSLGFGIAIATDDLTWLSALIQFPRDAARLSGGWRPLLAE